MPGERKTVVKESDDWLKNLFTAFARASETIDSLGGAQSRMDERFVQNQLKNRSKLRDFSSLSLNGGELRRASETIDSFCRRKKNSG
jgi:hypothetical protein